MIDDSNCWRGPGVVIGPDGKIVLIPTVVSTFEFQEAEL